MLQPLPPLVPAGAGTAADRVHVCAAGHGHRLAAAGGAAAAVNAAGCGRMCIVPQQVPHYLQLAKAITSLTEPERKQQKQQNKEFVVRVCIVAEQMPHYLKLAKAVAGLVKPERKQQQQLNNASVMRVCIVAEQVPNYLKLAKAVTSLVEPASSSRKKAGPLSYAQKGTSCKQASAGATQPPACQGRHQSGDPCTRQQQWDGTRAVC